VFPEAVVQTCILHLLRNSMDFVSWKDREGAGDGAHHRRPARPVSPAGRKQGGYGWEYVHVAIDDHSRLSFSQFIQTKKALAPSGI
jgi:hypothetical protein